MIGLDKAKAIIHGADPDLDSMLTLHPPLLINY